MKSAPPKVIESIRKNKVCFKGGCLIYVLGFFQEKPAKKSSEMASSDNLASIEPWTFRPSFADSWISEAFARDTETLTKALQQSLSNYSSPDPVISPFFNLVKPETTPPPPQSAGSGSDLETSKRRNSIPATGKPTKRKSRASKRNTTTFITADPANFRQMVQQVTGVRFGGNGHLPVAPVLKPAPQRPVNRMQGCLPTLDTSAFLLDHQHQQQQVVGSTTAAEMVAAQSSSPGMNTAAALVAECGAGVDFDSFSSFPTLESWKVM
ncbi:unnamed protein product [Camellia sinensis]